MTTFRTSLPEDFAGRLDQTDARLAALEKVAHPPARDVVSGAEFDALERRVTALERQRT